MRNRKQPVHQKKSRSSSRLKHHPRWRLFLLIALPVLALVAAIIVTLLVKSHSVQAPTQSPSSTKQTPKETPKKTPKRVPSPKPQPTAPTTYSTVDPASVWVIVNKKHPLQPATYTPSNLTYVGGQQLRTEPAGALNQLFSGASQAGHRLQVLSGYRSYATQVSVYNSYVRSDGQANADTYSARPGYSEHQTGLAVDVGNGTCNLSACFGNTPAGKWLAINAYKYGFIIRYPASKTAVTGYMYEPWHLRYVGVELATKMHKKNILTLEEYFNISGGTMY